MRKLERQAEREKLDAQRARDAYAGYQKNILASERLRAEIAKGVSSGERVDALFLKAVKTIGLMTGDAAFLERIESKWAERNAGGDGKKG